MAKTSHIGVAQQSFTFSRYGIGAALVAVLLASACQYGEDALGRDPDGEEVVFVSVDLSRPGSWPECVVASTPSVRIGASAGEPSEEFNEVSDALRLPDGRILVVNRMTQEVRTFNSSGDFLSSFGGKGGGPGEFSDPLKIALFENDSLAVWDWGTYRVSIFTSEGEYSRTTERLRTPDSNAGGFFGVVDSEAPFVLSVTDMESFPRRQGTVSDLQYHLIRYDPDGTIRDTLGTVPLGQIGLSDAGRLGFPLFAPLGAITSRGKMLAWSAGGPPELGIIDLQHMRQSTLRWQTSDRRVGPEDAHLEYERQFSRFVGHEGIARRLREQLDAFPVPDSFPAVSNLEFDPTGNLWVQRYTRPTWEADEWWAFDPEGHLVCALSLPLKTTVFEFGSDYILAKVRDELDVEFVLLFDLIRP